MTNASKDRYTIADLAEEFRITARTLRYYEDQGLIKPIREGQNRIYGKADHVRISWVLRAKRVGFSIADITEMLDLYNLEDGRARQREVTLEKCQARITALKAQREDLDITIDELSVFCETLESLETDPATGALLDGKTGEPVNLDDSKF